MITTTEDSVDFCKIQIPVHRRPIPLRLGSRPEWVRVWFHIVSSRLPRSHLWISCWIQPSTSRRALNWSQQSFAHQAQDGCRPDALKQIEHHKPPTASNFTRRHVITSSPTWRLILWHVPILYKPLKTWLVQSDRAAKVAAKPWLTLALHYHTHLTHAVSHINHGILNEMQNRPTCLMNHRTGNIACKKVSHDTATVAVPR